MTETTQVYLYKNDFSRNWRNQYFSSADDKYIRVVQGEADSEVLEFHLLLNPSAPLDLTGKIVTFYLTKPDSQQIFLPTDIPAETAGQGIAAATLTAQCTAVSGIAKQGEVRVTDRDGSTLKFPVPDLYISASDTENAIESTPEFHALDVALSAANESLSTTVSVIEASQKMVDNSREAISAASAAAATADEKAAAANQASDSASGAAASAVSAAQNAAGSAQTADSAAQRANTAALNCETIAANITATIAAQVEAQKNLAGGLASLNAQKRLVQMPTAADVGSSNPNLLLNGNFSVWQRGTAFSVTDTAEYTYTADRWRVKAATAIAKDSSGLKTSAACTLEQRLEDADYLALSGKNVTLSYSADGTVVTRTYTLSSPVVSIPMTAGSVLNWVKLESGSTATPFSPRTNAEELLLCQRFYERQDGILICVMSPLNSFDQTFPYRVKKRSAASVQVYSPNGTPNKIGYYVNSWTDCDPPSAPRDNGSGDNIRIIAQGTGYFQFSFTADAELYSE